MNDIIKYLVEFGYSKSEAEWIISNHSLCTFKQDTLLNKCKEINRCLSKSYII